jgi:hypothetical protein
MAHMFPLLSEEIHSIECPSLKTCRALVYLFSSLFPFDVEYWPKSSVCAVEQVQLLAWQSATETGHQTDVRLGTSGEKRASACILRCAPTLVLAYSKPTAVWGTGRESLPLIVQNLEFLK